MVLHFCNIGKADRPRHSVDYAGRPPAPAQFHHNGLHYVPGKFKAPSLPNIALAAPYMHEGRFATLAEVVDHYAADGGMGKDKLRTRWFTDFPMTPRNRADLVAFLESLTDTSVTQSPEFAVQWPTENSDKRSRPTSRAP
jgi:cytochrome c peroxidase